MSESSTPLTGSSLEAQQAQAIAKQGTAESPTKVPTAGFESEITGAERVKNMAELQEKAPQVYRAMIEGIAQRIIADINRHSKRFKEAVRRGRQ